MAFAKINDNGNGGVICPIFHFWLQLNPLLSGLIESCGPADVWAPTPHSPPSPLAGTPAGPWALQPPPAASKTPAAPTATAQRVIHALRLLISIYFCISAPFIISEGLVEVERQDVLKGKYCPGGTIDSDVAYRPCYTFPPSQL